MRTVAVIGSFRRHFDKVREAAALLRGQGWVVAHPQGHVLEPARRFVRLSGDNAAHDDPTVQSVAMQRILGAEVVYVVAPGGYVGRTTCYEVGRVVQAGRPLYFSERPDDLPLSVPDAHVLPPKELAQLREPLWLYADAPGSSAELERTLLAARACGVVGRHAQLTERIIQGRLAGALSAEEDEALCDALGELWQQMSPAERARADTRMMWTAAEVARVRRAAARFDGFFQDVGGRGEDDAV